MVKLSASKAIAQKFGGTKNLIRISDGAIVKTIVSELRLLSKVSADLRA